MVLAQDTLSWLDDHLCQIIFKSHHAGWHYGLNMRCLCTNCECGLWHWPLTYWHGSYTRHFVWSWLSFLPNNFQIPPIFEMRLWVGHDSGMPQLKVSAVTLTFDLGIWFLHATHRLVTMIISAKWFLNTTMHDEVMGRTWIWNAQTLSAGCDLDLGTCPCIQHIVLSWLSFLPNNF